MKTKQKLLTGIGALAFMLLLALNVDLVENSSTLGTENFTLLMLELEATAQYGETIENCLDDYGNIIGCGQTTYPPCNNCGDAWRGQCSYITATVCRGGDGDCFVPYQNSCADFNCCSDPLH